MEEWEEHLIELLISKEIGETIDINEEAIINLYSYNSSFLDLLDYFGFVKKYNIWIYTKIKHIPKSITFEKLKKLKNNNNSWMSWFVDLDTYFNRK